MALVAGVVTLMGASISANDTLRTRTVTVALTHEAIAVDRPLRVLQVSDVHDLPREYQRRGIVEQAHRLKPDAIVLTGDVVNLYTRDFDRMRGFVADLVATGAPVYFIWGNHEHANPHFTASVVTDPGAQELVNERVRLDGAWGTVDLIGTDDYYSDRGDLRRAMAGARPGALSLVLSHSAEGVIQRELPDAHPDVVLSGHTHGGQIRLPFIGALWIPAQTAQGRQWDRGIFRFGPTTVYIDQGAGGSLFRFLAPSQISLIEISHP